MHLRAIDYCKSRAVYKGIDEWRVGILINLLWVADELVVRLRPVVVFA